jgi:hypothetical protein
MTTVLKERVLSCFDELSMTGIKPFALSPSRIQPFVGEPVALLGCNGSNVEACGESCRTRDGWPQDRPVEGRSARVPFNTARKKKPSPQSRGRGEGEGSVLWHEG